MDALFIERCDRLLPGGYRAFFPPAGAPFRGVTVNTLRLPTEAFGAHAPFRVEKSPFCPAGFYLLEEGGAGLHPYHHAGVYYVQEPSASAPAALLGVRPGERVLDLCAAPGGKTAQLGAALQGKGLLVANEFVSKRAAVLLSNIERMGIANAVVTNESAERLAEAFPGYFDRILVDAPCSGEGMFRKEPEALRQHSQRLIDSCAALQRELLASAAAALRPGGVLVYSTCTFSPEENEGTVGAFLREHLDFVLEDTSAQFGCPGHASCCGEGLIEVEKVRRIYPVHGGEGQFMARLRKVGEGAALVPGRGRLAPEKLPREAQRFLESSFPELCGAPAARHGARALLLPWEPVFLPKNLRVLRAGVLAGELVPGRGRDARFEPHHSLYMAFGGKCANRLELPVLDARVAAWLRGEQIAAPGQAAGYAAVTVDGFPLGFGKAGGGSLKNHYPKGLRNLK
ncbi:NOL1/NOP2/sun family putative RNA methylase [Anaerofilum sp. BX8]|uniref:NOL1/NOP2/sun family putative RNA methylase n=1 Tax=Anaerofilum hominis TaxID=2763016 RepID=A0A923IBS0_9FIRM|nr:NOL1/NOP2/sun family putative RNA methylase [Anaerofilum hominis]MBC5582073.1 NOL1/NOP2/sun family putative RNA methylase [Anaerofilum hominis]